MSTATKRVDYQKKQTTVGTLRIDPNLQRHRAVSLRQHGILVLCTLLQRANLQFLFPSVN